ncbi:MAG TPA: AAA family ATPase, partial [Alphaproteobacteria bacterium]|nr:AAA family ATPase [Alphaproteobacteria bacterium]
KEGSHFDLPIALALLAAMQIVPPDAVIDYTALGELSLDANIVFVPGVLAAAIA